ncbi:hypothetical protein GJ496_005427 [Pomphorhynchus laevis]|nr:hypothetical protein GJ496_005427 [Pomphorhynchus laevis]
MFTINEAKCKTHLKLAIERMKLLQKKKSENAMKARSEISSYIRANKIDRARIKVEHLIREDYMVEAIDVVELFCELLLARFLVFARSRQVDVSVEESVSSIIWAGPRLESEVPELRKVISCLLSKLGKTYIDECTCNKLQTVNEKLIQRMSIETPNRLLVEKYLVEIASSHGIVYKPDPVIMNQDQRWNLGQQYLINFGGKNEENKSENDPNEFAFVSPPPAFPTIYPSAPDLTATHPDCRLRVASPSQKIDLSKSATNTTDNSFSVNDKSYVEASDWYSSSDISTSMPMLGCGSLDMSLPDVPSTEIVASTTKQDDQSNLDFDDLSKRFQELRNRK